MNLISLDGVGKALGESPLFEGVSLGIDSGDRIGFVGRNGCGKSTFLRLLMGSLEVDSGSIARKRSLSVSMLEQRQVFGSGERLGDFLYGGEGTALGYATRLRRIAAEGGPMHGREAEALEQSLSASLGRDSSESGLLALERAYASLCDELGLPAMDSLLSTFSGGMLKKAAIARALAPGSELLILDEPTNHLDIETIEWLERKLLQGASAFVLVTHDRWFLDTACSAIMEIDRRAIYKYPGSYSDFLGRRIERTASLEKSESRRLTILKRELAWLARGARARATKSERRKDDIRAMQAAGLDRDKAMESFSTGHRRLGKKVLELRGVTKLWGGRTVIPAFSRTFKGGERVGLIGANGSGKTSFLDLVARRSLPDGGVVDVGENTHFAYFDQTGSTIDPSMEVLAYVKEHAERIKMRDGSFLDAETLLERFLFTRPMFEQKLSQLSGGELRRLQLVRLLAESPNFLLLDEPTNDLDIDTIELLEDFLEGFPGCVLAVSHDRAFLDANVDFLLSFEPGKPIVEHVGGYADYRAHRDAEAASLKRAAKVEARPGREEGGRSEASKRKLSYAERREFDAILDEISAFETERKELEGLFSSPVPDPAAMAAAGSRYAELGEVIEAKTARWEALADRADE
jgi:ATP-binding cassette subfamily F protein uup